MQDLYLSTSWVTLNKYSHAVSHGSKNRFQIIIMRHMAMYCHTRRSTMKGGNSLDSLFQKTLSLVVPVAVTVQSSSWTNVLRRTEVREIPWGRLNFASQILVWLIWRSLQSGATWNNHEVARKNREEFVIKPLLSFLSQKIELLSSLLAISAFPRLQNITSNMDITLTTTLSRKWHLT